MRTLRVRVMPLLALVAATGVASAQPSPPPDPNKIQVLIVNGQNVHDWRGTTPVLEQILESTGRFEVRVNEEFRGAGPETLAPYDLLVVNYYDRGAQDRWGDRANAAVEAFVRAGKGVLIYHLSLGAFDGWTEYEKMSGGNWRPNNGHHSARHDFDVDITDADHPILRGLRSPLRVLHDELYANLRWQPAGTYHVLARGAEWAATGKVTLPIPPEMSGTKE